MGLYRDRVTQLYVVVDVRRHAVIDSRDHGVVRGRVCVVDAAQVIGPPGEFEARDVIDGTESPTILESRTQTAVGAAVELTHVVQERCSRDRLLELQQMSLGKRQTQAAKLPK